MKKALFWLSLIIGIIIIFIGVIFQIQGLTTSGASAGRTGIPSSTLILNSKSLFIIGGFVIILSISTSFNKNQPEKETGYMNKKFYQKKETKKNKKRSRKNRKH